MVSFRLYPRIYVALGFVLSVMTIGSVGFVWIEGYTWVEALYMTVITVSTVGFGEVREFSEQFMLFTTFLILSILLTFSSSLSAFPPYFVSVSSIPLFPTFLY